MEYRTIDIDLPLLDGLIDIDTEVSDDFDLDVEFPTIDIDLSVSDSLIDINTDLLDDFDYEIEFPFVVVHGGLLPYYTGDYEVNPTFSSQTLGTKDKSMSDDVTINAIAVQSVTNPSGGNTIFIGMI